MDQFQLKQQIGQYTVQRQLGKGSFGTVYKAIQKSKSSLNNKPFYAIKTQTINAVKPMLHLQHQIFEKINKKFPNSSNKKGFSFPQVYQYTEDDFISYMVMQLLDSTLQDFANNQAKNIFSKDCLIRIFYNILNIVQHIHKIGYVHRDLKPSNFMLKINDQKQSTYPSSQFLQIKYNPIIYPIDLGLSKNYINPFTNKHISCKQNKKIVGTAIFCSINTHQGFQQSRRDDIEAIVYMVTYLVKKLPWQKVCKLDNKQNPNHNNNKTNKQLQSPTKKNQNQKTKQQMYDQIYQIKNTINFQQFFNDDSLIPSSFWPIYQHARKLQFEEQPQYDYLYGLLQKQHYRLTDRVLDKQNCLCFWGDLQKSGLKVQQKQQLQQKKQKKIKINFKIPDSKLKKTKQKTTQNEVQKNQIKTLKLDDTETQNSTSKKQCLHSIQKVNIIN